MVVSVKKEYVTLVEALYPQYNKVDVVGQPSHFIVEFEVTSQEQLYKLESYEPCIVISSVIFDEKWTEEEFKQKALEFRRVNFKSRKKTLHELDGLQGDEFVEALLSFLYTGSTPLEETDVLPVLTSIGSASFVTLYLEAIQQYPESKLQAAILTFLQKVQVDMESLFYKKKALQIGSKLKVRLNKCLSEWVQSDQSSLAFINFIIKLTV